VGFLAAEGGLLGTCKPRGYAPKSRER